MGYWETYKQNFLTGGGVLVRRYHSIGLVVPVFSTLYLWAIGAGVWNRPEGVAVEWWMQFVAETFSIVGKTEAELAKLGVSREIQEFSTFGFALLVFGVTLNAVVQGIVCFFARADKSAASVFVAKVRKNLRMDPRFFLFLCFIASAVFVQILFFDVGFDPTSYRFRRKYVFSEFYFLMDFLGGFAIQYFIGILVTTWIVLLKEEII